MASSNFGMRPGIILLREGTDTSQVRAFSHAAVKTQRGRPPGSFVCVCFHPWKATVFVLYIIVAHIYIFLFKQHHRELRKSFRISMPVKPLPIPFVPRSVRPVATS